MAGLHANWRQIAKWTKRALKATPAERQKMLPHQGERERARRRRHHGNTTASVTSAAATPTSSPATTAVRSNI